MTATLEGGEWSAARPGRTLLPGKDPVPIVQEAGWAPGPVWMDGKSRPTGMRSPDRPARSSVVISTELRGPHYKKVNKLKITQIRNPSVFILYEKNRQPLPAGSLSY